MHCILHNDFAKSVSFIALSSFLLIIKMRLFSKSAHWLSSLKARRLGSISGPADGFDLTARFKYLNALSI